MVPRLTERLRAVASILQGFSMFANKGWLTKEDGGGLDKPVLGVR